MASKRRAQMPGRRWRAPLARSVSGWKNKATTCWGPTRDCPLRAISGVRVGWSRALSGWRPRSPSWLESVTERLALVRLEALRLEPVVHGSIAAAELAELGLAARDVLDFSVNTNPLGPAPSVLHAVHSTDWSRYPGDDEEPLRGRLAQRAGVSPEQVVLGNGSAELMWLIALAALRAGDRAGIVGPTFGEYARAVRVVGATPIEVADPADAGSVRALFVCNPNNPTGHYRGPEEVDRLLEEHPDRLLVLDEAYAPFVDDRWRSEVLLERGNLV